MQEAIKKVGVGAAKQAASLKELICAECKARILRLMKDTPKWKMAINPNSFAIKMSGQLCPKCKRLARTSLKEQGGL